MSAARSSGTSSPSSNLFCLPAPETGQGVKDMHIRLSGLLCVCCLRPIISQTLTTLLGWSRGGHLSVCPRLSVSSSPKKEGGDIGPHEFAMSTLNDVSGWRGDRKLLAVLSVPALLRCPLPKSGQPRVLLC